jgi:hypothetical protein
MRVFVNCKVLSDEQAKVVLPLLKDAGLELAKDDSVELPEVYKEQWLALRRIEEEQDLPYTFLRREE